MGWRRWWVTHVLGWGWMSVHHPGGGGNYCGFTYTRGTAPLLLAQFAIAKVVVQQLYAGITLPTQLVPFFDNGFT